MQNIFGANIRRLRKERHITQEALAKEFGFTAQLISKWELGSCHPDILLLPKLAAYFGVSVDALLGGECSAPVQKVSDKTSAMQAIFEAWQEMNARIASSAGLDESGNSVFTPEECTRFIEMQEKIFDAVFSGALSDAAENYYKQFHICLAQEFTVLGDTENAVAHLEKSVWSDVR